MRSVLRRERKVMVSLEDPIMELLEKQVAAEDTTNSSYFRKIFLDKMIREGKLSAAEMQVLLTA